MNACTDILKRLVVDGQLDKPLPADCSRAHVEQALGSDGRAGEGRLSGVVRPWLELDGPGEGGKTRVWFDQDAVLMVFVTHPIIAEPVPDLLQRLGDPEADLDSRTRDFEYFIRDQVFASRGMTLTVAKPHQGGGPPVIKAAYYYVPTTAEDYVGKLGGKDPWVRKFPRR